MKPQYHHRSGSFERRRFLGALGAASVAFGSSSFLSIGKAFGQQAGGARFFLREDRFGRMFPGLPPFAQPSEQLAQALLDIGKPGGVLDARDNPAAGPVALIADPALSVDNANNAEHTAGTTFVGQFLDHDITFDLGSKLGVPVDPEDSLNTRTPAFDLDSVYGGGPSRSPALGGGRCPARHRWTSW